MFLNVQLYLTIIESSHEYYEYYVKIIFTQIIQIFILILSQKLFDDKLLGEATRFWCLVFAMHCFHKIILCIFKLLLLLLLQKSLLIVSESNLNCKYIEVRSTRETKTHGSEPKGTKPNYLWPPGCWFIGFISDDPPVTNPFD